MSQRLQFIPREEVGRDRWDAFVDASDEAWLWHRYDLIEALATWPRHEDASFALLDANSEIVSLVPLHRRAHGFGPLAVRSFSSLGGPARAADLSPVEVAAADSVMREQLQAILSNDGAMVLDVQLASLSPWLHGPSAPKANPLVPLGAQNRQIETWMVGLADTPEVIRKRYSELTRRELRKAQRSELRIREASGPRDLDIYYKLHLETYSRTGARPHPIDYFQAIFEKFLPHGLARILFAERLGQVVAAQNTALYKQGAYYWTGASVSDKQGGENRVLFDTQIMAAKEAGCARYETGQAFVNSADPKEAGLSRFKRSFGAELFSVYGGVIPSPRVGRHALWRMHATVRAMRNAWA